MKKSHINVKVLENFRYRTNLKKKCKGLTFGQSGFIILSYIANDERSY